MEVDKVTDKSLFISYFGKSEDYYLRVLTADRFNIKTYFNIWAFLFPLYWTVYRKLYLIFAIIFIISIYIGFLEDLYLVLTLSIVLRLIAGFTANYIYVEEAKEKVGLAKKNYPDESLQLHFLTRKGGVSESNVAYMVAISIILKILIKFLEL